MPDVKFCAKDGCHDVAVGVSRWDRNTRAELDYCRKHYVSDVLKDTVRCEVVGPCSITDCRTLKDVVPGGVVELDPHETNVAQLVYAGHVKVLPVSDHGSEVATKPKRSPGVTAPGQQGN